MKRAAVLALLLAAPVAGCVESPSAEGFLAVVPRIVDVVEQDARANAPGGAATGPLLMDLRSFVANGSQLVGEDLTSEQVTAAVGRPFEAVVEADSALLCDSPDATDCWVRRHGVYVHLNVVRGTEGQITALARGTVTDRSSFPTHICDRVWRMVFVREGAGWTLAERELRPVPTSC